jgi:outer membrane protein OmpA-like peptidoglycan-associated protein/uncharacterized protein YidB (DUF937 family)
MASTDSLTGESVGRQPPGSDVAPFDSLIADTADRFGLGANAAPLVREVLNMITGSPGGVSGFLNKFETAGLGSELASWLGRRDAPAMSTQLLDRMVGPAAIDGISSRLGLSRTAASSAVAYILPKLVGALTPGGTVPEPTVGRRMTEAHGGERERTTTYERPTYERPTYAERPRVTTTRTEQAPPQHIEVIPDEPHMSRWLWPLLGALALLGLGSYLFSANRPAPPPQVATRVPAPRAPAAPALLPHLTIANDNGVVRFSGAVHDQESRDAIINALKTVYGANNVHGDISVDLNRGAAPWLVNLRTALETLKVPGMQAVFDGNSINLGGVISDTDRNRIADTLRTTLGGGLVFGRLEDAISSKAASANNAVSSELASLKSGFTGADLTGILNRSIINFPAASSAVPPAAMTMLHAAAAHMKQLPPSTVIEVAGYTDNQGDAAANVKLSQDRAEAVRNVLIQAGVDPGKLVAKGYGSANPIAGNDLLEGRFRNRRIEYHVLTP